VARECDGPDRVDWAGLPVNLDLVFSQTQRDKVYAQHVMRRRGNLLWRWLHDEEQPRIGEVAEDGDLERDSATEHVESLRAAHTRG
jgi:hypothetical protein